MFEGPLRSNMAELFTPVHDYLSKLTGQAQFFADFPQVTQECPVPERQAVAQLLAQIPAADLPDPALRTFIDTLKRGYAV